MHTTQNAPYTATTDVLKRRAYHKPVCAELTRRRDRRDGGVGYLTDDAVATPRGERPSGGGDR